ncbi:MAG: sugar phosphate isomerase/epimerase [Clostridia bacterium]|nr:sugar phosphate isomerase/epimerase [Clostridia bacterium]
MKLSISNIAWPPEDDPEMLQFLRSNRFLGVEIAPLRVFPEYPDCEAGKAQGFSAALREKYGLAVSSIQAILYGRRERLFGNEAERKALSGCVKKALDLAAETGCHNIVFGSPKNRIIEGAGQYPIAVKFFEELAAYAEKRETVLSIEPNPAIYGTNFINTTKQAFELVKDVGLPGFRVNVDCGTVIQNEEEISCIEDHLALVNHLHISEPMLEPLKERRLHQRLADLLKGNGYDRFVSIEMKRQGNLGPVKAAAQYVRGVFGDD